METLELVQDPIALTYVNILNYIVPDWIELAQTFLNDIDSGETDFNLDFLDEPFPLD